ncbi:hypothetical protein Tco_0595128 [Tanacetum coccineum]
MMDIYDDRVKDVCEPKNDDSSTSTIVEEFESLLEKIIKQKEEVKGISDPAARRRAWDEDLNFIPNKELNKEDLIPIPRESKIGKECDFPTSFIPFEGSEMILEEEIDEFLKHDESLNMDLNDEIFRF